MSHRILALTVALAGLAPLALPGSARACGGCFHPPEGNPSPVTGHRMAVALGTTQTTLWDQIAYDGDPADFVWVLPIAGTSTVEIAENAFFESLVAHTTLTLVAPPPPRLTCDDVCGDGFFAAAESSDRGASVDDRGGVTVHHEGVVGPYATATIGSDDPGALLAWLRENRYQVPDAMLPTIEHYVGLGMNFVVLRLSPSANVQRMAPVRVTVPGLSTTFPLRMVAAGVEVSVELELFVFAESRIEAANFGNAEVDRAAISFDWATRTFDYDARYEDALFAGEGTGTNWVTELAGPAPSSIGSYTSFPDDGSPSTTAEADWTVVTASVAEPYLTRMRTRLPVSELGVDLQLRMSDRGDLTERRILVRSERNRAPEPECPTFCAMPDGFGPGTGSARGRGESFRCSTTLPGGEGARGALGLLALGLVALAVRRRRA